MNVVHLTDSPFFGGPERQIIGLAVTLPESIRTTILCFRDNDSCAPFLKQLHRAGVSARMLGHANPQFFRMISDIVSELRAERADLLVCHGYKADTLGWIAARWLGLPVFSVSRGWTGHTRKVRLNESLDRVMLRLMKRVVCVSEGQAEKVRKAGVSVDRIRVIRNAIDTTRFDNGNDAGRASLEALFPLKPRLIVLGVGRLSPEKGFDQFVDAASVILQTNTDVGFALIGDGPDRGMLEQRVKALGIENRLVFAGFRNDIDRLIAAADVLAQSSYTEGLPNVVLEACAASVPVVATDVGGTGEVVRDGEAGYLVPAGDHRALAARLIDLIASPSTRAEMGARGRTIVSRDFSFAHQSSEYVRLFHEVANRPQIEVREPSPA